MTVKRDLRTVSIYIFYKYLFFIGKNFHVKPHGIVALFTVNENDVFRHGESDFTPTLKRETFSGNYDE